MEDDYNREHEYDESPMHSNEYFGTLNRVYEEFLNYYEGEISFEEWRCLVDVSYRQVHGEFPLWDHDMDDHLDEVAYDIGQELIDKYDEMLAEAEQVEAVQKQSEKLFRHIEKMLEFRAIVAFDRGHPSNRRFQRREIYRYTNDDFSDTEIESGANYDEALTHLEKEGYITLVEKGAKEKYDVFQAMQV